MHPMPDTDDDAVPPRFSVGDPVSRRTRLLTRQCDTCIFRSGNPMHLPPGRLKSMVEQAVADGGYVICHDTLPYGNYPETPPAVCRGFADRYRTWRLQVIAELFGFIDVEPPAEPAGDGKDRTG